MKKKAIISIVMVLILSITMVFPAFAVPNDNIKIKVNNKILSFSTEKPFMDSDMKVYVPMRSIAEALGASVEWIKDTNTAVIKNGSDRIDINLSKKSINVNEIPARFNSSVKITGNKTYVTLNFFNELFNVNVDWDEETWTVNIENEPVRNENFTNQSALSGEDKTLSDKLNNYLDSIEKYENFHGAILVAKAGKILVDKAYGMANFEQGIKNKPDTTYPIASITKVFTATAIMQLEEKGLLSVNDKLSKYIPDFKRGDEITLKNLLTHTSGVSPDVCYSLPLKGNSLEKVVNTLKTMDLNFDPGTSTEYNNDGFQLLTYIIQKVSGMSYIDYLKKNIFEPTGMNSSDIIYSNGEKNYQSTGYYGYIDTYPSRDENLMKTCWGSGDISSTVEDLYLFDRALYTDTLLTQKTLDTMYKSYTTYNDMGQGYAWEVEDGEYGKVVSHSGDFYGFTNRLTRYIDKDVVIISLMNNFPTMYNGKYVDKNLENIVFGKEYQAPKEVCKLINGVDPKIYDDYVGLYKTDIGIDIKIDKQLNGLYLNFITIAGVVGQVYPMSETEFFLKEGSGKVTFKKDKSGKVTGLVLTEYGFDITANKASSEPSVNKKAMKVDPKVFDQYTGEYSVGDDFKVKIMKINNKLYFHKLLDLSPCPRSEIFQESENVYFDVAYGIQVTFEKDNKGKVVKALFNIGGKNTEANKTR